MNLKMLLRLRDPLSEIRTVGQKIAQSKKNCWPCLNVSLQDTGRREVSNEGRNPEDISAPGEEISP